MSQRMEDVSVADNTATTLELHLPSGERLEVVSLPSDTVLDVRKHVAAAHGVPLQFLRLVADTEEVSDSILASEFEGVPLSICILSRVPFEESIVPEGSIVAVDGVQARFTMWSPGGFSSEKIRFVFDPPGHPELGSLFQVKDWMFTKPGLMDYRNCSRPLLVEWLLPQGGSIVPDSGSAAGKAAYQWLVVGRSVRVRAAADLDSEVVGFLQGDMRLAVEEGCYLCDADCTPRLRISSPIKGWITPYLSSSQRTLVKPLPEHAGEMNGQLGEITQFLL